MVRKLRWDIVIALFLFSRVADAEPPRGHDGDCANRDESSAVEERAFETELARQERLFALTRTLAERAFAEAAERFVRYSDLTKRLAEQERAREQQDFETAIDLYLRKRELTRTLATRARPAPTPSLSAPDW